MRTNRRDAIRTGRHPGFRGHIALSSRVLVEGQEPLPPNAPLSFHLVGILAADVYTCEPAQNCRALFCRGTPRSETEAFTRLTAAEELLLPAFQGLNVEVVVCGHTHMPFDRTIGDVRVANARAGLLLGEQLQLRHTSYDLARVRGHQHSAASAGRGRPAGADGYLVPLIPAVVPSGR